MYFTTIIIEKDDKNISSATSRILKTMGMDVMKFKSRTVLNGMRLLESLVIEK